MESNQILILQNNRLHEHDHVSKQTTGSSLQSNDPACTLPPLTKQQVAITSIIKGTIFQDPTPASSKTVQSPTCTTNVSKPLRSKLNSSNCFGEAPSNSNSHSLSSTMQPNLIEFSLPQMCQRTEKFLVQNLPYAISPSLSDHIVNQYPKNSLISRTCPFVPVSLAKEEEKHKIFCNTLQDDSRNYQELDSYDRECLRKLRQILAKKKRGSRGRFEKKPKK